MNSTSNISALNEDIIVEQLLRTHDPDGRWIDSQMLLQEVETILSFVQQSDVSKPLLTDNCMTHIEVFELKETIANAISRISVQVTDHPFLLKSILPVKMHVGTEILKFLSLQMLCPCMGENEIHSRTMVLFHLLKEYRWDAKAVLVLGALAATYGRLLLPIHLAFSDPVAASIATLNQLPGHQKCPCMPAADRLFQAAPTGGSYASPFTFFSNSLPWISVRRPWLMSSTVVNFLRTEWPYRDGETMMVVMDTDGKVVNMDAMDMVLIWGVRAYPFSVSREDELWEEDDGWSLQLLLDGIHPEFDTWVNEGREICIFGSDNSDWVDEIKSLTRKIQKQGFEFELIYLSPRTITSVSAVEESSILFGPAVQQLFWLRLESIKRSKLKRIESSKPDRVFEEVTELLDFDYGKHKGWAVIGKGSAAETGKIVGEKLMERMRRILRWGEYASGLGFTEAIRIAEDKPCEQSHTVVVPFEDGGSTMSVVTCEKCKRPMKKFVAYQ